MRGNAHPALRGAILAAALALAGCAPRAQLLRKPYTPPTLIAVLPFENATNNLPAGPMMRHLVMDALVRSGYSVMPVKQVDAQLREAGITQDGQVRSRPATELARLTGAPYILYGNVTAFSYVTLAVYQKREVGLAVELLAADGTPVWRPAAVASRQEFDPNAAKNLGNMAGAMGIQLAGKWLEKIFAHPLYPEMQRCVHDVFMTLPSAHDPKRPAGKWVPKGYELPDDFFKEVFCGF